ncbi:MAG: hypothetical protein U0234_09880 [Sandaracinus sp.]
MRVRAGWLLSTTLALGCVASPSATPEDAASSALDAASAPGDAAPDAARPDAGPRSSDAAITPAPEAMLSHTFPTVDLAAGDERLELCQAWTLNNDEPIYVDSVTMDAGPGWHHSNWMWVPDTQFPGDDGTFRCRDREFDELAAALGGGGVFFAQSTQATHEVQSFEPGAAFLVPPHARIIGAIHVFNLTADPVSTALTFTVHGLPSTHVTTLLHGLALDDRGIDIAPHSTTRVELSCDLDAAVRGPLTARIHYVLPHFHGLTTGWELFAVGGPSDGALVYGTSSGIGDPLGGRLETPFDLTGATGLRLRCTYENPGSDAVTWGPYRTDEMCMVLAYVDGDHQFGGQSTGTPTTTTDPDGTVEQRSTCIAIAH